MNNHCEGKMAKFGFRFALAAAAIGASIPASALAADDSISMRLSAEVKPFCQVRADSTDSAITLVDGRADLGAVREVCNTHGYIVRASFTNLAGGTVFAGNDRTGIDGGLAEFRHGYAQAITRAWQLHDAVQQNAAAPTYFTVSIMPL